MVFSKKRASLVNSRRFSLSEFNGAIAVELSEEQDTNNNINDASDRSGGDGTHRSHSTSSSSFRGNPFVPPRHNSIISDASSNNNNMTLAADGETLANEMNLDSIRSAIAVDKKRSSGPDITHDTDEADDADSTGAMDTQAHVGTTSSNTVRHRNSISSSHHNHYPQHKRRSTMESVQSNRSSIKSFSLSNKLFSHHHHTSRRPSVDITVAPSSSASRTSYSSSAGTNIWTKLLGGSNPDGLWDGLNHKGGDAYAVKEDDDFNDSLSDHHLDGEGTCITSTKKSLKRCGLSYYYESRHFFHTAAKYPHIWMLSLLTFGILCTVGLVAINAERDAYVVKQKGTAEFVARETARWFSNEFRRAMLPLYSVQQGVVHSGYFDDLPSKIGPYPNLVIPETEETPFTKRDVSGICDDPNYVSKWRSIVEPINTDNDLDGIVVGYRLFPNNVACLTEPHAQESTEHFSAEDFPQGEALLSSDNVFGLDTGHSEFPLWKMITTDLFINKQFNIFGPFAMPPMSELICGHLAIWQSDDGTTADNDGNVVPWDPQDASDQEGEASTLDVHGTPVRGAWGFAVNFLDWTKLKEKSNIYERFANCKLEFRLTRVGGATAPGIDSALLAESPSSHLLTDDNSIIVETNSLHGLWQNRVGSLSGWNPPWYAAAVAGVVLGSLILGFLTATALVERQLHRNLLYKVMPKRAIAKLQRGQTVLEKFNLVTIFFSDIVGFTSMAGSMRPIQVMKMLNELYTELDKLVEKHQVYKVETIGDAYMVVGGAPDRVLAPLAAERVALFALDAIDFVKNFRTKDGDQVFIRAGLASGPTVAGVVGQAMPRYCFFGDTVNFASRMESTSKKMRIQCAEITYRLLQDSPNMNFGLKKRMEGDVAGVEIKGKGHQVTYWIEKSTPRNFSHKVIDIVPRDSGSLEGVTEDDEEAQPSSQLQDISDKDSEAAYEEFLKVMNSTPKPEQ